MSATPPNISREHAVETYKSLISVSVDGMKLLAILNGGAAVALGNLHETLARSIDVRVAMAGYLTGLVCCGLAFFSSYMTQFWLYQESLGWRIVGMHQRWLWPAIGLCLCSLAAFTFTSALVLICVR